MNYLNRKISVLSLANLGYLFTCILRLLALTH